MFRKNQSVRNETTSLSSLSFCESSWHVASRIQLEWHRWNPLTSLHRSVQVAHPSTWKVYLGVCPLWSFRCKSLLHCKILFPHSSSSTNWFCWIWVPVIDQPDNAHNTPWPLKKCGHAGTLVLRILYNMYVAISMCNVSLDQKLCLHLTCLYHRLISTSLRTCILYASVDLSESHFKMIYV